MLRIAYIAFCIASCLLMRKAGAEDEVLSHQFVEIDKVALDLDSARGLALDRENRLYIAAEKGVIRLGAAGTQEVCFPTSAPLTALAIGPQNQIFAAMRTGIVEFSPAGEKQAAWGEEGEGPEQFQYITCLAVRGNFLYVADAGNRRIARYAVDGDYVDSVGGFFIPSPYFDCAINPAGELLVAHTGKHRVERYDGNMRMLSHWGQYGGTPSTFSGCCNPTHLAVLPDGNLTVTEKGIPTLKLFSPSGDLLAWLDDSHFPQTTRGLDLSVGNAGRLYLLEPHKKEVRVYEIKKTGEAHHAQ